MPLRCTSAWWVMRCDQGSAGPGKAYMTGGCHVGGGGGSLRCTGSGSRGRGFGGFGGGLGPGKLGRPFRTTSSFLTPFFTGSCCLLWRRYKTMRTAAKRRRRMVRRPATTPKSTSMGRNPRSDSSVLGSVEEAYCSSERKPERSFSIDANCCWKPKPPTTGGCQERVSSCFGGVQTCCRDTFSASP